MLNLLLFGLAVIPGMLADTLAPSTNDALIPQGFEGESYSPERIDAIPERISSLQLPEGFMVSVFAEGLGRPRIMAVDPASSGTVYVTTRDSEVLRLRDADGDGKAESKETVLKLDGVHGITLHEGRMYLATVGEVFVADMQGEEIGEPQRIITGMPTAGGHHNRTIGFGPADGLLYITVGSTCNSCIEANVENAAMLVADPGSNWERRVFASGLRNTIGFGWHPQTGEIWGMDHGSDWLGDDFPPEELNQIHEGHYGWPFVHGEQKPIPTLESHETIGNLAEFAKTTIPMVLGYRAHSAPIQLAFYTGEQFPEEYRGDAFVAMHGSWNRKPASGYEVIRISFDEDGKPLGIEPFLTGFMSEADGTFFGRPAGVAVAQDGSLLVGDDNNGMVYRVSYGQ